MVESQDAIFWDLLTLLAHTGSEDTCKSQNVVFVISLMVFGKTLMGFFAYSDGIVDSYYFFSVVSGIFDTDS